MYSLDWTPRGLIRSYSGQVSWRDLEQSIAAVHSDERFPRLKYIINDFSRCTSVNLTPQEIERLALRSSTAEVFHTTHYRVGFVVTDPGILDQVRLYLGLNITRSNTRIFDTLPSALAWVAGPGEAQA